MSCVMVLARVLSPVVHACNQASMALCRNGEVYFGLALVSSMTAFRLNHCATVFRYCCEGESALT
eukprot:7754480-Prorocentrum_lima.AAC.1